MNPTLVYRLTPGVAIRTERFGALAYHHQHRQLFFIHSREAADFLIGLTGDQPLAAALDAFRMRRGLPEDATASLLQALARLETLGLVTLAA